MNPRFAHALNLRASGALGEADAELEALLRVEPGHAEALHLRGVIALERGEPAGAMGHFRAALAVNPDYAEAHMNFGNALVDLGRVEEALVEIRTAIRLAPRLAMAHNSLGLAFQKLGQWQAALAAHRRAVEVLTDYPEAWTNFGNVHRALGRHEEAIEAHRRALALRPGDAAAHVNLAAALHAAGRLEEAIAAYGDGLARDPTLVAAQNDFAMTLRSAGRLPEALSVLELARSLAPDDALTLHNLGVVLGELGRLAEARATLERAVRLDAGSARAYYALGNVLRDLGAAPAAVGMFRTAVRLDPGFSEAWSNLLFLLNFVPGETDASLVRANQDWARTLPVPAVVQFANIREPGRRLRIGYHSAEFRRHHFVAEFLPVLQAHDRAMFHVACYADVAAPDDVTEAIAARADGFRNLHGLDPDAQADAIRADGVDILVGLTGYLAKDRHLLARRAAPVQATYVNHLTSTGLATVDYRITDAWVDPPDAEVPLDLERPVRLASGFSVFAPPEDAPDPGPPPALAAGYVTFGSFNNLLKVTDDALRLWAAVLARVPRARLLVKARDLSRKDVGVAFVARLRAAGVDTDRCELVGAIPDRRAHLEHCARVDIGLDPVPFAGGATTREMLWMGLPVVTLAGPTRAARLGASLLARAGLPDLVARSAEHYVAIAAGLADDPQRLAALRAGQRARLRASALLDAAGHTRELEAAYRWMWRRWCERA